MNKASESTIERRKTISMAAVLSWIPLVPVFWLLAEPLLIRAVSEAVAEDIQYQVQIEIRPLNSAFKVLLQRDILSLKKDIASVEFKRDHSANSWTGEDAEKLVYLEDELEALEKAKKEL